MQKTKYFAYFYRFGLYFLNVTFSVIWYLKPFVSFKRSLNNSLIFDLLASNWLISQSYFSFPKDVRLNSTHYLIIKIKNKRELQNIAINQSADIDYKDFMKIYRECTKDRFNFLTIDTTLPASDLLRFRKNLLPSDKSGSNWSD